MQHSKTIAIGSVIFYLALIWNQNAPAQTRLLHHDDGPSAQVEALVVPQGQARLFDKYSDVPFNDEKARLDNFAIELHQNPGNTGYIIVFGKIGKAKYLAKKRADRAKEYLLYYRNIDRERIVSLDHCVRRTLEFELWIVPSGARAPVPCRTATTKPVITKHR